MTKTLSKADEKKAKALYKKFRRQYPGVKNPSDINTKKKAEFLLLVGWEAISLMQKARKKGYAFTK